MFTIKVSFIRTICFYSIVAIYTNDLFLILGIENSLQCILITTGGWYQITFNLAKSVFLLVMYINF